MRHHPGITPGNTLGINADVCGITRHHFAPFRTSSPMPGVIPAPFLTFAEHRACVGVCSCVRSTRTPTRKLASPDIEI